MYRQANPANLGACAGLLRTFGCLGAIASAAAQGCFYGHSVNTNGMHHLALFLVVVSAAFLLITVLDPVADPKRHRLTINGQPTGLTHAGRK